MSLIEEGLYTYLTSQAAITDLAGTRIYPLKLPQGVSYPAIRYQDISEVGLMAHDGPLDLFKSRFQFDCYARTYIAAKQLAQVLRATINGYAGAMGTVTVEHVFFIDWEDDHDDSANVWRVRCDYFIQYKEA